MNNALFTEIEGACSVHPADLALSFKYIGKKYIFEKCILLNTATHFELKKKDPKTFFFLDPELHGRFPADLLSVVDLRLCSTDRVYSKSNTGIFLI